MAAPVHRSIWHAPQMLSCTMDDGMKRPTWPRLRHQKLPFEQAEVPGSSEPSAQSQ